MSRFAATGQVATFEQLEEMVEEFKKVLLKCGIGIEPGSELDRMCLAVENVLAKHKRPELRDPKEDIRIVYAYILALWVFMVKIIRLQTHPDFKQLIPHLKLLNEGSLNQNIALNVNTEPPKKLDASNKIFELLLALVLLDVGRNLILDDPKQARGNNPDVLITIEGKRWGFACKAVYGPSGIRFFKNLEKAVNQIEASEAEIGCAVISFRHLLDRKRYFPILNEDAFLKGAEPEFGVRLDSTVIGGDMRDQVYQKGKQVLSEVGEKTNNLFKGKKAIPAFLAWCQAATATANSTSAVPTAISALILVPFVEEARVWQPLFCKINNALHERKQA